MTAGPMEADPVGATTLGAAVKSEFVALWRPPRVVLTAVAINGILMCAGWFFLPTKMRDSLFSLHGPLAFPFVLAAWMLADTPSTNVLASNTAAALSVLGDRQQLRRKLLARSIVLASLVALPCIVAAVLVADEASQYWVLPFASALIVTLPFGIVAVASWLGIIFPYHPRPLRWRWQQRRERRAVVRWVLLVTLPYVLVPAIGAAIAAPGMAIAVAIGGGTHKLYELSTGALTVGCIIACGTGIAAFFAGESVAVWLTEKRQEKLDSYLRQPDRG